MAEEPEDTVVRMLRQLGVEIGRMQRSHAAMRAVLRAVVESHPNPRALLERLDFQAALRRESDLAQPIADEEAEEIQAELARWRKAIAGG